MNRAVSIEFFKKIIKLASDLDPSKMIPKDFFENDLGELFQHFVAQ
jgi:hypothetical protein